MFCKDIITGFEWLVLYEMKNKSKKQIKYINIWLECQKKLSVFGQKDGIMINII